MREQARTAQRFAAAVLPLQRVVVFPETITPITATRQPHLALIEAHERLGSPLVAVLQRADTSTSVGCLVRAHRMVRLHDGSQRLALAAERRVQQIEPGLFVYADLPLQGDADAALAALHTAIHARLARVGATMPEAIVSASGLHQTACAAASVLLRHDPELQQQLLELDTLDTFVAELIGAITRGV